MNKSKQYAAMTRQTNEFLSCTYKKKIEYHTARGGLDHYDMFSTWKVEIWYIKIKSHGKLGTSSIVREQEWWCLDYV